MQVTINGKPRDVQPSLRLRALLVELALDPRTTLVEHNRVVIARQSYDDLVLQDGDQLELVRFVGGG